MNCSFPVETTMRLRIFCIIYFAVLFAFSQEGQPASLITIKGVVVDAKTKEPIPYCNVYISQTLIGTYTDHDGRFSLVLDRISGPLVISSVGYDTYSKNLSNESIDLHVELVPSLQELDNIEVVTQRDKSWEKRLKEFEEVILGETTFSKQCEILNPWVISFIGRGKKFAAKADAPIKITNSALGFNVEMVLKKFVKTPSFNEYQGLFRFDQIQPQTEKQKSSWEKGRQTAYHGSINHFLKCLAEESLEASGFYLEDYTLNGNASGQFEMANFLEVEQLNDLYKLKIKRPFVVNYELELTSGLQRTLLSGLQKEIWFDSKGILVDPSSLKISGYMASEGISTLLPFEYYNDPKLENKLNALFRAFQDYPSSRPTKLFTRTDKEAYFAGETIWLKTHIVEAKDNRPKYEADLIHLVLENDSNQVISHSRLRYTNGYASGSIVLPDTLPTGHYYLKTYTKAFENGNQTAFTREIKISNFENLELPQSTLNHWLLFFPEGGQLIHGHATSIAFRSNLSKFVARLFDKEGNEISVFESLEHGVGEFTFLPSLDQEYYVVIEGIDRKYYLPPVETDGGSVHVQDLEAHSLKLIASGSYNGSGFYILIHNAGELLYLDRITIEKEQHLTVGKFLKEGINHVVLFDQDKRPLSERLIFKSLSQNTFLKIAASKGVASNREEVSVRLKLDEAKTDETLVDLSVSVIDSEQTNAAIDIVSYLKIFSDLNIPLTSDSQDLITLFRSNPDIFLKIFGWKRFSWDSYFEGFQQPQTETIDISGNIQTRKEKPIRDALLALINTQNGAIYQSISDSKGKFRFQDVQVNDTSQLVIKAMGLPKFSSKPNIRIEKEGSHIAYKINPKTFDSLRIDHSSENSEVARLAYERKLLSKLNDVSFLDQVVVTTKKVTPIDPRKVAFGEGDHSLKTEAIAGYENLPHVFNIIEGRIPGLRIIRESGYGNASNQYIFLRGVSTIRNPQKRNAALVMVDNTPVESSQLYSLSPADIESVEIYSGGSSAIFGSRGSNGVVAFYTKKGSQNKLPASDPSLKSFIYENGYYTYDQFVHPNYSISNPSDLYHDFRSTLYWNPNVSLTNAEEKELTFFTSDRKTKLLIDIQGLTQKGELIHETMIIEVK